MSKVTDFKCTFNDDGISAEISRKLSLTYPDAYLNCLTMIKIAKAVKEQHNSKFCILPFCHTLEAEAMGGKINYGDEIAGPRAKEYIFTSAAELMKLQTIDFSKGRISDVLKACKQLRDEGEEVILNISGPFTILNVLIDFKYIVKALMKEHELMKSVYARISNELLRLIQEGKKNGVRVFNYADSAGALGILGPKISEQVVSDFTYPFFKEVEKLLQGDSLILLCPKSALALIGTDHAEYKDIDVQPDTPFEQACVQMIGKAKFTGQMCIKNSSYTLKQGKFKELVLK